LFEEAAHQVDLTIQPAREPRRIDDDQKHHPAQQEANRNQKQVEGAECPSLQPDPERQNEIGEKECTQANAEKPNKPAIGLPGSVFATDMMRSHYQSFPAR
jgi:hypothetical protein